MKDETASPGETSYRDLTLDEEARTVRLHRPLTLDLGAVAKGFAIDLAVSALRPFTNFLIDAGGDIYAGGQNEDGMPWQIGIRHPLQTDAVLCTVKASDLAICTSGGYERPSPSHAGMHHVVHPGTGLSPSGIVSSTVLAPFAMMADAASTVAFLQNSPEEGIEWIEQAGLDGLLVEDTLQIHMTNGMKGYLT